MKIVNYILGLILVTGAVSCSDKDYTMIDSALENPQLTASATDLVLEGEEADQEGVNFTWDVLETGVNTPVSYILEMVKGGGDFSDPVTLMVSDETSFSLSVKQLNARALSLDLEPEEKGTLDVRVLAQVGSSNGKVFVSNTATLTVVPYTGILDLSTTWGVVGDATPNGWDGPDIPVYQTGKKDVLAAYATLTDGEIKFRENNEWVNDFGGENGELVPGGANIEVEAGQYQITMNLEELTYSLKKFSLGIVGDATANGWDGPDQELTFDETSGKFRTLITLTDGQIKFRLNDAWDEDWGGSDGNLVAGGDNIDVQAGTYLISVDLDGETYELEPLDQVWGVVGDATPNGWEGPDIPLQIDYASDYASGNGIWYAENVELTDGEIKFRANNSWDLDYGSDAADGNLGQGAANIPVSAGVYTITLNLDNLTYELEVQ